MVAWSVIYASTVIMLLCLTVFLGGLVFMVKRFEGTVKAFFLGAAGFFMSSVILRSPLISLSAMLPGYEEFLENHYIIYIFIIALLAGVLEAVGRLGILQLGLKGSPTYEQGIAAGFGHGALEAVVVLCPVYFNNIVFSLMINQGVYEDIMKSAGIPDRQMDIIKAAIVGLKLEDVYLGGLERALIVICQIGFTMIMVHYIRRIRMLRGLLICAGTQIVFNFTAGVLQGLSTPYMGNAAGKVTGSILVNGFLALAAAGSFLFIRRLKKQEWAKKAQ